MIKNVLKKKRFRERLSSSSCRVLHHLVLTMLSFLSPADAGRNGRRQDEAIQP